MADEEVMGAASPAPSDHKRKLDDLDSEPFDQPSAATASNGNSELVVDGVAYDEAPVDGVAPEDPEVKRPRRDEKPDDSETAENGQQEERAEDPKEDIDMAELLAVEKNTEQEEGQEKADEPMYAVNKEPVTDVTHTAAIEQESSENPEEPANGEHREPSGECQDPPPDAAQQGDVFDAENQLTSRKMEVPTNKVGVLIGKAGDTVRTLQYNSGARIQITRDADADPNSTTRPVELIGSLENINKAEKLINDVISEADTGASALLVTRGFGTFRSRGGAEQIQIQVPNEKVGSIIGKGGEAIKNLQTRSGARIQLIPQHLPEGDPPKERTMRFTGGRRQIEMAREMIKETMNQPLRSSGPTSGYNQQTFRPRGTRAHPSQRAPYPSQNPRYENRPSHQRGPYGYGGQGPHAAAPSGSRPVHSRAPGPVMSPPPSQTNYNYGPPQGPEFRQTVPQGYNNHAHPYGSHGPQPPVGPYYGPPRRSQPSQSYGPNPPPQQPYPYASSGPMQQAYMGPGAPQPAPAYAPSGPAVSYGQYPTTQPSYAEQAPTNNTGYGYQGAADPTYAGAPPAAYSQPNYDQSAPQSGGYGSGPVAYGKSMPLQPPPGYIQYDSSQMYVGQR